MGLFHELAWFVVNSPHKLLAGLSSRIRVTSLMSIHELVLQGEEREQETISMAIKRLNPSEKKTMLPFFPPRLSVVQAVG